MNEKLVASRMFKLLYVTFFISLLIIGCGRNSKKVSEEASATEWVQLDQKVTLKFHGSSHSDDKQSKPDYYYVYHISFEPLCLDDNIKSIEYGLENVNGTFMDENTDPYKDNVQNKSYVLEENSQENIYFSIYFHMNTALSMQEKFAYADSVFSAARIQMTITYNNGTTKERIFALKASYPENYNLKYYNIYELV